MENVKLYVLEQHEEIKGFVVADNVSEAMKIIQSQVDEATESEEYYRDFIIVPNRLGIADYVIEVRENYKGNSEQRGMSTAIVAETYDVFEFDFVMNRIYGTI